MNNVADEAGDAPRDTPGQQRLGSFAIERELGRGGMGVVYLAHDSRLGRRVALKVLNERAGADSQFLGRFQREARLLASINHPNIGAIFGLEEERGQPFLVLEYVPGETLAERLKRGALPLHESIDVCAQIAAALDAAHKHGIVHRDLKPDNVKIAPNGVVKVLDFGLAKRVHDDSGAPHAQTLELSQPGLVMGTIAYMAPEQMRGQEIDARVDVWALGCVLYECLTGRKAFGGASFLDTSAAVLHKQPDWTALPSSTPASLDGLLHRALSKERNERPASAAEFAASFPGSAALRAAVAAGQTPTPAMVAAAEGRGWSARQAAIWLCVALLSIATSAVLARRVFIEGIEPPRRSPEELAQRARQVLRALGHEQVPRDEAWLYGHDRDYLAMSAAEGGSRRRRGRAELVYFWYRASPAAMHATALDLTDDPNEVTPFNPPTDLPGMVTVFLDTAGRLIELRAMPLGRALGQKPDWARVFAAAELDLESYSPTAPEALVAAPVDTRAAWRHDGGTALGDPVRVEAGALGGEITYFKVFWPWTRSLGADRTLLASFLESNYSFIFSIGLIMLACGSFVARRNVRAGIADVRGATRLSLYFGAIVVCAWACQANHAANLVVEMFMLLGTCGYAIFAAGTVWVAYLALEPIARKHWPWRIIGWSRLLGGRLNDRVVGRELLIGVAAGAALNALAMFGAAFIPRFNGEAWPEFIGYQSLWTGRLLSAIGQLLAVHQEMLFVSLAYAGVYFVATRLVRREWLVVVATYVVLVAMTPKLDPAVPVPVDVWFTLVYAAALIQLARSIGILALTAATFTYELLIAIPPLGAAEWTRANGALLVTILVALVLLAYACASKRDTNSSVILAEA